MFQETEQSKAFRLIYECLLDSGKSKSEAFAIIVAIKDSTNKENFLLN